MGSLRTAVCARVRARDTLTPPDADGRTVRADETREMVPGAGGWSGVALAVRMCFQ